MAISVRLKSIREQRGLSAAGLATLVGISRQSVYQIEDGGFLPNTAVALRIARALDVAVEDLFFLDLEAPEPASVRASSLPGYDFSIGQTVRLCRVGERCVAVPSSFVPAYLPPADGVVAASSKLFLDVRGNPPPETGKRILVAGCDPALSLLADELNSHGIEVIGVPCSSRKALQRLKLGHVHAAGTHLLDHATGEYNVPIIRRVLPDVPLRVVTFAFWEQGLLVQPGNPRCISSFADLAGRRLRLINREKGSGSRDLLDIGLRKAGLSPSLVGGYDTVATGHLTAAHAVATGSADCCVAPRSAARCFGLDFIPLGSERFDLCFPLATLDLPAVKAVLDTLHHSRLRRKLQSIAGYDTRHTGEVVL